MKTKLIGTTLLAAMLLATVSACGKRDGELTGAAFVVTRGGMNVKLGLVPVNVYPEDALRSHIERKRAQANAELPSVRQAIKAAQASSDAAWQEVARIKTAAGITGAFYNNPALDDAKLVGQAADERLSELREKGRSLTSWQYYMDGLPSAVSTTQTDADGKFTLTVPRNGKVALAARASRAVGDSQEDYYWFVWVSLDGKPTGQVMLSNDNLWGQSSTQIVVSSNPLKFSDPLPLAPPDEVAKLTTTQFTAASEAIRRGDSTEKVSEVLRDEKAKELAGKRSGR